MMHYQLYAIFSRNNSSFYIQISTFEKIVYFSSSKVNQIKNENSCKTQFHTQSIYFYLESATT